MDAADSSDGVDSLDNLWILQKRSSHHCNKLFFIPCQSRNGYTSVEL